MIQEVERYENYINSLPDLMAKSYYKADYFMTNLGLKHATYYRKLRLNNFTIAEIKKITEVLLGQDEQLMNILGTEFANFSKSISLSGLTSKNVSSFAIKVSYYLNLFLAMKIKESASKMEETLFLV
jgi:hypothetical protein